MTETTLLLDHATAASNGHAHESASGAVYGRASIDRFGIDWQGRSVVVVGLARSGIAACRLLHRMGCRVSVSELRDHDAVRAAAQQLKEQGIERAEVGRHSRQMLDGSEAVIVSPGVPESAPPIQWALEAGIPILSEIELAFRMCPAPIVAVTGTNGKSSSVMLIQRVLEAARKRAIACGNIGLPFSDVVSTLTPESVAVVEVSSFQLLWCERFHPTIGVLLNLGTNHLDRHADHAAYREAKARLFRCQTPDDYAVLNCGDEQVASLSQGIHAQHVWVGTDSVNAPRFHLDAATCRLLPESRQAVLQVARIFGIPDPLTYQVMREFRGLEHRLEYVAIIRGVTVVNDAKSTTPDSLLYALSRCPGPVVPIIGGKDKGLDFHPLQAALTHERIRGIVLIGETRPRLKQLLKGSSIVREGQTLADALRQAMGLAHAGDTVLFSPACASFDMFLDFEERGRLFKQLVRSQFITHNL